MKEVDKDALLRAINKKLNESIGIEVEPLTEEEQSALLWHIRKLEEEYEDVVY